MQEFPPPGVADEMDRAMGPRSVSSGLGPDCHGLKFYGVLPVIQKSRGEMNSTMESCGINGTNMIHMIKLTTSLMCKNLSLLAADDNTSKTGVLVLLPLICWVILKFIEYWNAHIPFQPWRHGGFSHDFPKSEM